MVHGIFIFILVFCILILIRESFAFIKALITNGEKYMTNSRLLILALAISYITTIIFTGIPI